MFGSLVAPWLSQFGSRRVCGRPWQSKVGDVIQYVECPWLKYFPGEVFVEQFLRLVRRIGAGQGEQDRDVVVIAAGSGRLQLHSEQTLNTRRAASVVKSSEKKWPKSLHVVPVSTPQDT